MGAEERRSVLKKALKEWETAFAVLHERRPNKEDIEKASDKIKGYYKEYRQLGRSNSENVIVKDETSREEKNKSAVKRNKNHSEEKLCSSDDRNGTGNVWGSHLNRKEKKDESDDTKEKVPDSREPVYGLKLREFNKVKILPNSARKRTNPSKLKAANVSASEQEPTENDDMDSAHFNLPSCKFVTKSDKLKNSSVASSVTPSILAMKKPRQSLDNAWLKRCQTNLITASGKTTNDVPTIIEDNDPEDEFRMLQYKDDNFITDGQRISVSKIKSHDQKHGENGNIPTLKSSSPENERAASNSFESNDINVQKNDTLAPTDFEIKRQKREREEEPSPTSNEHSFAENRSKIRKVDSVEESQNGNIEYRNENHTDHGDRTDEMAFSNKATQPCNTKNRNERDDEEVGDPGTDGEKEAVKPKKKKKLTIPAGSVRSSASLNENFVKINLKKKVYIRAPNKMTGPAYKRQQWKIKMGQASGKSYSRGGGGGGGGWRKPGVCFKCGQEGHWAKFCKGRRAPVKPDVEEDDEVKPEDLAESPFPTLEEAAIAATGIKHPKGEVTFNFLNTIAPPHDDDSPAIRTAVEPLFELNDHGKPIETPKKVYKALKELGFDSFRGGQEKAIMRILSGLSTLVVLSTGAGKSLCYQLAAYMYAQRSHCITLVISPLVSLMEDQVIGLPGCIQGARLHSNMTKSQREKVVKEITDGHVQVLLISPEAVVGGGGGGGCLPPLHQLPPIAFACIDEAHCVSEWSHNFRPSYLMVCKVIRERFGVQCLLGLTATATMSTAMSVVSHLGIDGDAVVRGRSVPNNLKLSVSKDENRERALVELLQGDRFNNLDSVIVYCIRRDQTEKVASILRTCLQDIQRKRKQAPAEDLEEVEKKETPEEVETKETSQDVKKKGKKKTKKEKKIKKPKKMTYKTTKLNPNERPEFNSVEAYHAGMSACQRRKVQNAFMSGSMRIVVATVAFGMGLDKSDVRAIIHYNMPKSFESYVQEIGRAGRDGKPAQCHLFLDPQGRDLSELRRHTYANTLDRFTLKKLCRKVFALCRCKEKVAAMQAAKDAEAFEDDDADYMMIPDEMLTQKESSAEVIPQPEQIDAVENTGTSDALQNVSSELTTTEELEKGCESAAAPPCLEMKPGFKIQRLCPGHERAVPIEQTVETLDIKEEGIATLLCHLELHPQQWVSNLPPALATCNISCYGGPKQLQATAHKCPALAAAVALHQQKTGKSLKNKSSFEFPVVDVASEMNWQSGLVKRELKNLQWNGKMKSGIMVELSELGFHFRSPGDLTDEELDGVVDFLYSKVKGQEKREVFQLKSVYKALNSVSCDHFWMCSADVDEETSDELKTILRDYFDQKSLVQWMEDDDEMHLDDSIVASAASVRGSVRAFISLHHDRDFSGRAIARIFHGIGSPCYPAKVWGRDRRFWRCHLDFDFNLLIKIATEVVLQMR